MNERRLKLVMISMNIVACWGAKIGKEIEKSLPGDCVILRQKEDFNIGSLVMVVYNKEWGVVPDGNKLPRVNLEMDAPEAKGAIILDYPH